MTNAVRLALAGLVAPWGFACASLTADVPIRMPDGSIERVQVDARSPGALCLNYERQAGSFTMSVSPTSDFGTVRAFEWLVLMAAYVAPWGNPPDDAAQDDRPDPHDACAFLYRGDAQVLELEDLGGIRFKLEEVDAGDAG